MSDSVLTSTLAPVLVTHYEKNKIEIVSAKTLDSTSDYWDRDGCVFTTTSQ